MSLEALFRTEKKPSQFSMGPDKKAETGNKEPAFLHAPAPGGFHGSPSPRGDLQRLLGSQRRQGPLNGTEKGERFHAFEILNEPVYAPVAVGDVVVLGASVFLRPDYILECRVSYGGNAENGLEGGRVLREDAHPAGDSRGQAENGCFADPSGSSEKKNAQGQVVERRDHDVGVPDHVFHFFSFGKVVLFGNPDGRIVIRRSVSDVTSSLLLSTVSVKQEPWRFMFDRLYPSKSTRIKRPVPQRVSITATTAPMPPQPIIRTDERLLPFMVPPQKKRRAQNTNRHKKDDGGTGRMVQRDQCFM